MKIKLGAVLAFAALQGCASTEKVLNEPVDQTFHSEKSADEMSFCLANRNNTAPLPRDDGSRVVLVKNGYGAVSLAFSIYPEGKGSRVEYRKKFGTVGGAWKRCVGLQPEKG